MTLSALPRAEIRDQLGRATAFLAKLYIDGEDMPPTEARYLFLARRVVDSVSDALRTGNAIHFDQLALMLDGAAHIIREADQHIQDAVIELGELQTRLDDDARIGRESMDH